MQPLSSNVLSTDFAGSPVARPQQAAEPAHGGAPAVVEVPPEETFEKDGDLVCEGYLDDPRDTDNAWMETRAVHLHLSGDDAKIRWHAGDDADGAPWMEVHQQNLCRLYASHGDFVGKAVQGFQKSTGSRVLVDGSVV